MHTLSESSPENYTLDLADFIGVESCVDLKTDLDPDFTSDNYRCGKINDRRREMKEEKNKDYPPPIPWLQASTENLPPYMPWVLRRYHTGDGRLIIREEKAERREYFRAHRSNGRLTLHLVPLGDDDDVPEKLIGGDVSNDFDQEKEEIEDNVLHCSDNDASSEDQAGGKLPEVSTAGIVGGGGVGGVNNCFKYNGVKTNSCMFGIAVPIHNSYVTS